MAPACRRAVLYQLILKLIKSSVGKCYYIPPYLYTGLLGIQMLRLRDTAENVQVHGLKKKQKYVQECTVSVRIQTVKKVSDFPPGCH